MTKIIALILITILTSCSVYKNPTGTFIGSLGGEVTLKDKQGLVYTSNNQRSFYDATKVANFYIAGETIKNVVKSGTKYLGKKDDNKVKSSNNKLLSKNHINDNNTSIEKLKLNNKLKSKKLDLEKLKLEEEE